ncbi:unnamed protein product [Miscanthus lutarioriparius]|uniref:VQ domain-containing protein n=1 Tax=Miscanthus lutarioriparius TaxID=422564 RepID=A0A811QRZ6_9POAL|nr:unnamed protein product [Miscanthus lutarioriparius]
MPSRSSSSMMEPSLLQCHHDLQLQGPRPAPLKVSTSTTGTETVVKKRRLHHHQAPPRQPVIIYVESPRVVHAHPAEFKSVVQRLTGAPAPAPPSPPTMVYSASAPPPLQLQFPFQFPLVGAGSAGALLPLTSSIVSATVADASGSSSSVLENLSSHPFLLPLPSSSSSSSLAAACYHQHHAGGDLFIAHHQ